MKKSSSDISVYENSSKG